MKTKRNKTIAISIVILLMISMGGSLILLPSVNAHSPSWTIASHPYLVVSPNPVGVGQTVAVVMWIDEPLPAATLTNDIRRHDYTLTITKPDGITESKHWDVVSDSTSIQYYEFTPSQIGNYTLKFDYAGQTYTWTTPSYDYSGNEIPNEFTNDTLTPASKTITLEVQAEPRPFPISDYPLPNEYWTRPVDGQNWNWYTIASSWLGAPYIPEAGEIYPQNGYHQNIGTAPNSAHVMWTKPIQYGGIAGGNNTAVTGEAFYTGNSYNARWSNPIIMYGTMFYEEPFGNAGTGGDYVAVDLRTGQELWRIDPSATGERLVPKFGYLNSYDTGNQHGVLPNGLLIATTGGWGPETWKAYDPQTGKLLPMTINNVPSGSAVAGPNGEYLKYVFQNLGTADNPKYYLAQWNSSKVLSPDANNEYEVGNIAWYTGTADASVSYAYDWNISLALPAGEWSVPFYFWQSVPFIDYNNVMLLYQGVAGAHPFDMSAGTSWGVSPAKLTAVSLKQGSIGQVLWAQSYSPPENNSRYLTTWDPQQGIFIFRDRHLMDIYAYSIATGEKLWGPVSLLDNDFATDLGFLDSSAETCGYGKVFVAGYNGLVKAFDGKTGNLVWTYGNGGGDNSTFIGGVGPFGRSPLFLNVVADGKIFTSSVQHSPNSPLYMNYKFRALNATTGAEIWDIYHYGTLMYSTTTTVADGYLSFLNNYDSQIYTIGKGPSETTVEAPMTAITLGSSLVIRGSVTDISAGTKQAEQATRFPNGVAAFSDASMSQWMEYVYQQKPMPTNTTGVPVTLSVLDANGNYRTIGTTTSNADGYFTYQWKPDIEGQYTVYASFGGSESYWPSHAVTSFAVDPAAATSSPYPVTVLPPTEMYIAAVGAAIIVAIAIVGVILAMMLRKRPSLQMDR